MGRVDEALKRAAGQLPATPAPAAVEELSGEPFPDEAPKATAAAPAPPPAPPPAKPEVLVLSAASPAGDGAAGPASSSIGFRHVDVEVTQKLVIDDHMIAASREQYRRLGAVLHAGQNATGLKVVMVASAVAGEGKTLTASNLALTLSESYHRNVLLIDADLRRPSLDGIFGIVSGSGLSEGLTSRVETPLNVCQVSPNLTVLPAGHPTHDPMAGLTSDRMRRLLEEARESFDWVIIDTPPTVLLSDAHLLASMVDGTILVVRANETPFDLIKRATEAIGRSRILGVVLNGAESVQTNYYYNYYGYRSKSAPAEGQ